ncbi:MAG: hypothetical protein H0X33_05970 [Taibaiella sp.]|nr:hypothetical protein [Taibaiella sp.]
MKLKVFSEDIMLSNYRYLATLRQIENSRYSLIVTGTKNESRGIFKYEVTIDCINDPVFDGNVPQNIKTATFALCKKACQKV